MITNHIVAERTPAVHTPRVNPANNPAPPQEHTRNADLLAEHGGAFCLIRPGEKKPIGLDWQRKPKTLTQARAHAGRGGNVGLLGGPGGLVVIDADQDAAGAVRLLPQLGRTRRYWRDNARERGKYVLHVTDGLPPNVKHHASGTEIISTGGQAVIHGTHPSGAVIRWDGDEIADVTLTELADFWRARTGQELGQHAAQGEAGPPDAEAVQRSIILVDKVLALANVRRAPWKPHDGTGRKAIMQNCPFQPEDDPHVEDAGAAVLVGADGRIGATCHHARCKERIEAAGGNGWALLKTIAGYKPPATAEDRAHVLAVVEFLREWVRRADLAEHVPIVLQACNGYRTRDTDTDVADAILDVAAKWGRLTNLPISLGMVRAAVGLGSKATARAALARQVGWFVVEDAPAEGMHAARYSLHPSIVAAAEDGVAYIAPVVSEQGDSLAAKPTGAIYATSPGTTHRAHDAFTASTTPITEAELQARIEARQMEIAEAEAVHLEPPPPIERSRYRRRLAASLPSAGRTVKRMIDALYTDGPALPRRELRDLLHLSSSALSRTVKRAKALALVDDDGQVVTLRSDWSAHLENIVEFMPTAGRADRLDIADADATLRFARHRMAAKDCPPEERATLEGRCIWASKRKAAIARRDGAQRPPPAWAAPRVDAEAEAERIRRLRELIAHGERAERRAAEAETPTPADIWRLHVAGYTDAEIAADLLRGGLLLQTVRGQGLESDMTAVRGWAMPTIHFDGPHLAAAAD